MNGYLHHTTAKEKLGEQQRFGDELFPRIAKYGTRQEEKCRKLSREKWGSLGFLYAQSHRAMQIRET